LIDNEQNNQQKGFLAKHFIQINSTFAFSSENSRFSCVHGHTHVTFADASHDFNGDRLIKIGAALRTKLQKS